MKLREGNVFSRVCVSVCSHGRPCTGPWPWSLQGPGSASPAQGPIPSVRGHGPGPLDMLKLV